MNTSGFYDTEDVLFPSDNTLDIPCLRIDRQAGHLAVPLAAYGTGRKMAKAKAVHALLSLGQSAGRIKKEAGTQHRNTDPAVPRRNLRRTNFEAPTFADEGWISNKPHAFFQALL